MAEKGKHAAGQIPYADILEATMAELEAYKREFTLRAKTKEQKAVAKHFGKFISDTYKLVVKLGEATLSAAPALPSSMPTPEEWRKTKAEWMHEHRQRHMDDRGVKYEDQAERKLDHEAARGNAAAGPPHPWPSEFVSQNRHQPGQDHGKSNGDEKANGRDAGYSM